MKKLRYDLHPDGRVKRIGFLEELAYEAQGNEPFFLEPDDAFNYKLSGGTWGRWKDISSDYLPETLIKQALSNTPGFPNITREALVKYIRIDLWDNMLFVDILVRHYRPNLQPLLNYDEIITLELSNNLELKDPVTNIKKGAFTLFGLRMLRDGLTLPQVIKELIVFADNKGYINSIISIYNR